MLKGGTLAKPIKLVFFVTVLFGLLTFIAPLFFQEEIFRFGKYLLERYGQDRVDVFIFLITVVSSTPIALPVWTYAVYGSMMGYDLVRLVFVISLGSTLGSSLTYLLGRYFGKTNFVRNKFPNLEDHPWTNGKSLWIVSFLLFAGTLAPIPIDVMYAACGLKRYPWPLFVIFVFFGKVTTYYLITTGWNLIQNASYFAMFS